MSASGPQGGEAHGTTRRLALFAVADGVQSVALEMLRGLQDARVPMLMAIGGYFITKWSWRVWIAHKWRHRHVCNQD